MGKLKESDGSAFLETVKDWFAKADQSSLERYVSSFVGPVLDVQGFVRGDLNGHVIGLFEDRNRTKLLSLCYVVDPTESLCQTVKGKNYSVYLIKELKKTGLRWGILTNGNIWRLYNTKEKALYENFFEVNLSTVIENEDKLEAALFATLLNVQVFLVSESGNSSLDFSIYESEQTTKAIEEHLQNKMEDILGKICMGFIQSEGKKAYTDREKQVIFNNSIYFLYRLLFVLYAEARGFLPINNPKYKEKSITQLMETVDKSRIEGLPDPNGRSLWNVLSEVFNWINQGNRDLGIPPYNGGLFDDSEKPYLANHSINNAFLSDVLFNLGFKQEIDGVKKIRYDDLSVRHLGGLYEGILEYQLFIAPEQMVRRKQENVFKFIPSRLVGKIVRNDIVMKQGMYIFRSRVKNENYQEAIIPLSILSAT